MAAVPIERVSVAAYIIPTDAPEADGTLTWNSTTMVTAHIAAGGRVGFGYGYAGTAAAHLLRDVLAPLLEGRDAMETAARWREMVDAVRNHGLCGIAAMAISAADAALHDLRGKLLDAPLSQLLGARRGRVPLYGSGGFLTYAPDRMDAQIGSWVEDGFGAVKIKVGADRKVEAGRIARARAAAGEAALMIDANGACTRKEALELAAIGADHDVRWFEEPVSSDDLAGLRLVRDRGPAGMDVAAGEYGFEAGHFRRLIEAGAVDVLQADATRCCGITGLLQADALCWAHRVPLSLHCAPALHLQPALCLQRLMHQEWFHDHVRIEAMLLDGAPRAVDGHSVPADPGRPGLGLELKEKDAERWRAPG